MYAFAHLRRSPGRLGTPLSDCQANCLGLPAEQQAKCMSTCAELASQGTQQGTQTKAAAGIFGVLLATALGTFLGGLVVYNIEERHYKGY